MTGQRAMAPAASSAVQPAALAPHRCLARRLYLRRCRDALPTGSREMEGALPRNPLVRTRSGVGRGARLVRRSQTGEARLAIGVRRSTRIADRDSVNAPG